jgi:Protein of unknown function (DUF3443)
LNFKPSSMLVAAPFLLCVLCLLGLAGCGSSNNNTTTTAMKVNNTANLVASFGPNGPAGGPNGVLVNGIFITVTVCQHGSTNCVSIPNVQVDTGSIGLRILPSALGSVALSQILVNGSALLECIQFGDTSYSWGPMQLGDVQIAGEQASNIPIQVLGATTAPVPSNCLQMPVNPSLPNGGNEDTLATLGSNGILGIAGFISDCGTGCTTVSFTSGYPYYTCPSGNCGAVPVPTNEQATNMVAAFSSPDKNGFMITFPSVAATGATSLSGTINFGIGTQTDNALSNVTVFAMDACGDFPTVTFNGVSYTDTNCNNTGSGLGGFLDTGSNALYVSDATTLAPLGISDCSSTSNGSGFYCVNGGGTVTLSNIALAGFGGVGSGMVNLNIMDATKLFTTNNAVYNDLGSDSVLGGSPSTDFFDFGSPFFFGKTVYVGIAGQAVPNVLNAPNGFVAF